MKIGLILKIAGKSKKMVTNAKKFSKKFKKLNKNLKKAMKARKRLALKKFKKLRQRMFRNMKPGFLKCKVLRAEPVDSVSGEVVVEQQDFMITGRIPFEWNRYYGSQTRRIGVCGQGWETPADVRLEIIEDGTVVFYDGTGAPSYFDYLPNEKPVFEFVDGGMLKKEKDFYTIRVKEDLKYYFPVPKEPKSEILIEHIEDLCGNSIHYVRDKNGLKQIKESSGRCIDVISKDGLIQKMYLVYPYRDPHYLVGYEYDENNELVTVYDAMNVPYRFRYKDHLLIQHTDRNGLSFYYDYDEYNPDGKCVHSWGDGGLYDYRFVYREEEKTTEVTDSLGNVSYLKYDDSYMIIEDKDPLGGITSYEYDYAGRTTAVVDPDGNRTDYVYDKRGNLTRLIRPDGNSIVTEFDDGNKPVKITDPNGAIWRQEWDNRGLLVKDISPIGAESKYSYDNLGQLVSFIDPLGAETRFIYDDYGNSISITDALDSTTKFKYNSLGDISERVDPLGKKIRYEYDMKGRLTKVFLPSGANAICVYDAEDNLISYKDENGNETRFEYFGLGEIKRRIQPDGGIVEYHYDTEENLIALTNQRGERYELNRDALGRIISEVDYWGQKKKYVFTAAGYLRESIDPLGRVVQYKTDPLGRIIEKVLPDPYEKGKFQSETFQYDPNGNLISCENSNIRIEWKYDTDGQMLEERQGEGIVISNIYDLNGNRTQRTTSIEIDGKTHIRTVNYNYDILDQVISIETPGYDSLQFKRNALGQLTHETLSKSLKRRFEYNEEGYLQAQKVLSLGGPIFEQVYNYDKIGNLTHKRDFVYGVDKLTYSPIGRVVSHLTPEDKIKHYLYDSAGDLMSTKIEDDRDEWCREGVYGGLNYSFDRAGNLVNRSGEKKQSKFVWDTNQRLIESINSGCKTIYRYDPLGRRISKETDGVVIRFFWDEEVLLGDFSCTWLREWIYYTDTFEPLAMIQVDGTGSNESLYFYHNDPNGCPGRLMDIDGKVVWAARYDAMGKVECLLINEVDNPLRLQGQYFDDESELYYNRYRYFNPELSNFIGQDPLGLEAGENLYAYAPNIYAWVDPLGLTCTRSRAGRQKVLRDLATDQKQPKHIRGWAKNELRRIKQGRTKSVRLPYSSRTSTRARNMGMKRVESGYDLAHLRGKESAKGFNYKDSFLQEKELHRIQHKHDLGGKLNKTKI